MRDAWSLPGKKRTWMENLIHAIRLSFDYFCLNQLSLNVRMFCMLFIELFWLFTQTHERLTSQRHISSEVHNNLYLMELIR